MNSILSLVILLGAIQGGVLSVVLFNSKVNRTANKVLSITVFTISLALLLAYFQVTLDYRLYTFQIKSILPLSLVFVPLFYLYTKLSTKENKQITLYDLKYFLPFIVIFIYNIPFYFGSSEEKIEYFERENISGSAFWSDQLEIVLVNVVIFAFSILIFLLVRKMRKNFEDEVSNYSRELVKLMFFMAFSILTFTLTGLILSLLQIWGIHYPEILDFLTAIGSTLLIYFIGYYTLLHPRIFHPLKQEETKKENAKLEVENKEILYDDFLAKMVLRMETDKIYRNPELTLQSFSDKVNIPSYLVSKIINTKTGLNFYNFVNRYRIEEVKQELKKSTSPKIMQIAFAAGFNTKSSFYNYFKKDTGLSPKDYIK